MKFLADKIINTAYDAKNLAARLVSGGVEYLRTTIGALPLFAGTRVYEATDDLVADETHYFLIPFRTVEEGYAISVQRMLPAGHGLENDLPKRRVFHLPALSARERLEAILTAGLTRENLALTQESTHSEFAERLERIAGEIDKQSDRVTGGLLIIGGAVAIANPLLGVAIAAKAIFPSLGSKITNEALRFIGGKFRASAKRGVEEAAQEKAAGEVKRLEPFIFADPLLALLESVLSNDDPSYDPYAAMPEPDDSPASKRQREITAKAITQTYADILAATDPPPAAKLHAADIAWLRWLARLVSEK
jgi:hypothetical protein